MLTIDAGRRVALLCWATALVLALTAAPAAAQADKPLTIEGQLRATDPLDRLRQQSHHEVHEVDLKKGHLYLIELRSGAFDPFLRVEDARGKKLAENDNISKEDLNSRLGFVPGATARYRLVVTAFAGQQTGPYVLHLRALLPAGEAKTIENKLTKDSPRVQGRHTRVYKVPVQAGRWYLIDLSSAEFDPCLVLRDGQGKVLAVDKDGGGERNARLLWYGEKGGAWHIQAVALAPGSTGECTLRLRPYQGGKAELTEREQLAREARQVNAAAEDQYRKGNHGEALRSFERALTLYERLYPKQDHPELAQSLSNLGFVLGALGQPAKALPHLER